MDASGPQTADILESISDAFYALDDEWRFTYINRKAEELWGRSRQDLIGQAFLDAFPDAAGTAAHAAHLRAVRERRVIQIETVSPVLGAWVDVSICPSEGGLSVYFHDISERKQSEEALRQSQASAERQRRLYEAILANTPDLAYVFDLRHRFIYANEGLLRMWGRSWDEAIGKNCLELGYPDWHAAMHDREIEQVIATRQPIRGEVPFTGTFGRRIYDYIFVPVLGPDGAVEAIAGTTRDVTERKHMEEALAEARDNLEARVHAEVAAREAAQARLIQTEKLAALGQLAGGIAHDFNNVIQAIAGGAALIQRRADDPAAVRKLAPMLEDAAHRGASITRRLLAFARRGELRAEPIDIPSLLEGLREVLEHTLGPAVAVNLDVAPELLSALADPGQLETVLVNLATNARDAMPAGGKLVLSARVETVADAGHSSGIAPGRYVRLDVTDTGEGMDAAILARATEPFFTTKPPGRGTGLGLSMARGFAEQSEGGFQIVSEPGQGTTVTMWLPAADAAAAALPAQGETGSALTGQIAPRILLVDDEDLVRETLAAVLSDHGYEVVQAKRGKLALELLESGEAVDVLVSDLAMPEMDGVAVIQAAQRCRPRLPAILLTGYAGEAASMAVGGAVSGMFSLMRKPVTGPQIADRIATLLEAVAIC